MPTLPKLDSANPWRNDEVDDVGSVCIPTQERGQCPPYLNYQRSVARHHRLARVVKNDA